MGKYDFFWFILILGSLFFTLSSFSAIDSETFDAIDDEETCFVRTETVNYHWVRFKDKEVTKSVYCVSDTHLQ